METTMTITNPADDIAASRAARLAAAEAATADDLVLCESPDGWSLHAPGSTGWEIAEGDAWYLANGDHPITDADYTRALRELVRRVAEED
jgi:hypothetical protein